MRLLALLISGLIGYLNTPCHTGAVADAAPAAATVSDCGRAA